MYILTQIESATPQTVSTQVNTWSPWGINLLDAPELQSGNNVINVENYNLNANWNFESRKWTVEFLSSSVWKPVRMFEKMSSNIWVFSAWNEVFYYNATTTVITSIWTYWEETDTDFVGWISWDYLLFTNWSWKIQYLTFDYWSDLVSWASFLPYIWASQEWYSDEASSNWPHTLSASWDPTYPWTLSPSPSVNYPAINTAMAKKVWGLDNNFWTIATRNPWDVSEYNLEEWSGKNFSIITWDQVLMLDDHAEVESNALSVWTSELSSWGFSFKSDFTLVRNKVYEIRCTVQNWDDILFDNLILTWFAESIKINNSISTEQVFYVSSITDWTTEIWISWFNRDNWLSWKIQLGLSNITIKERQEALSAWELSSSPFWAKRLLVFSDWDWDRLYCGNILWDPTAIKYSELNQVKDLWEVPFQAWTPSTTSWGALLRTSAWGFTNSNLWELKDLGIQVNKTTGVRGEVLALFENWKKTFHIDIDTIEESWIAIQVQKIISEERQDFWWERNPLLIQEWIFYTNEAWVWQMFTLGQEVNISDILWEKFVESVDYNDLILTYNHRNKSWTKYTWLNIERFLKDSGTIYWTSSIDTKVYKLFEWTDDDWEAISTEFKFEVPLRLKTIFSLEDFLIKWEFTWDEFEIILDIYDDKWVLDTWTKRIYSNLQNINNFSTLITSLTRLIVTIKCNTTDQHKITYLLAWIKTIQENTFRKSYTWPTSLTTEAWDFLITEGWATLITT